MSERCPTCGRPVPTIFEHVDADCENWPDDWTVEEFARAGRPTDRYRVTWIVDGRQCAFEGTEIQVRETRHFMLYISPLKRDDISEVIKL